MCGLVWAAAREAQQLVPAALKRLQYRGYDSFGFSCWLEVGFESHRSLEDLRCFDEPLPASEMVLGHTRWATHGKVSLENCHPHADPRERFVLAHNGIVENMATLSAQSAAEGESDSALIAHLLSAELDGGATQSQAFVAVARQLQGRNSLLVMFHDGEVCAYRKGSPLTLIELEHGVALASDVLAFPDSAVGCLPLQDGQWLNFRAGNLKVYKQLDSEDEQDWHWLPLEQDDFLAEQAVSHSLPPGGFMAREIFDQWRTLALPLPRADQSAGHSTDLSTALGDLMKQREPLIVTGAGGAGIVADQIAQMVGALTAKPALSVSPGEIHRYRSFFADAVLLAVSQSGETADTLCAIEAVQDLGVPVVSLVNMPFSTMARVSDLSLPLGIGPEHCVLSTKSATAQLAFGYWLTGLINQTANETAQEVQMLGQRLSEELHHGVMSAFGSAVEYLQGHSSVFLLGRQQHFATAALGALNLKEAAYIHAEAFSAGELKHGVIALIEPGTPVILFDLANDPYMAGVAAELKSRGATILAVGSGQGDIELPQFAGGHVLTAPITCQILAYLLALAKGIDPDRPRNLAKSVTVL